MIETKTDDYKSHKHEYNVYVEINSKTKLGRDLLEQYHKQAQRQYIDIGRIGYHDKYGKYVIDHYSLFELISVPKLIISVTEMAIDKAGRDVYKLRTYMSKFGQLNFLLLVDRTSAELILVENVFIENLNHKENYETPIYKLRYSSREQVLLREIFWKFNIRANPDDYGKAWKNKESVINNVIVAKAKAEMTIQLANRLASNINQKALITSLNYLNKEGSYGKNVTKEYSKIVSKSKELNALTTSPKLENTLNHVLVKTLEQQTTKIDLKDKTNYSIYKKVLDVELSSHNEVKKEVNKANNKQNLKEFLLDTYGKHNSTLDNEEEINDKKFKTFEKIIDKQYIHEPNKEVTKPIEEDFKAKDIVIDNKEEYFDFYNNKIEINFNLDRFKQPESEEKKLAKKQKEKVEKKQEKKQNKILKKLNKNVKELNAECDLDSEFEKSKLSLGLSPNDSKKKRKKALKLFFGEENKKHKAKKEENLSSNNSFEDTNKLSIIEKIEKQIRSQKLLFGKKIKETKTKSSVKKQNPKSKNISLFNKSKDKKTRLKNEQKTNQSGLNANKLAQSNNQSNVNSQSVVEEYRTKKKQQINERSLSDPIILNDKNEKKQLVEQNDFTTVNIPKKPNNIIKNDEPIMSHYEKTSFQHNLYEPPKSKGTKKQKNTEDLGREM